MDNQELKPFQSQLMKLVQNLLSKKELDFDIAMKGEKETYVYFTCKSLSLQIWLYEDEAEYRTSEIERMFEWQDYSSPEGLRDDFLNSLNNFIDLQ